MKSAIVYYVFMFLILVAQGTSKGSLLFPLPKEISLNFPSTEQKFSPQFPVMSPGLRPSFPSAEIIFQERLFAPFIVLKDQDLSHKNLARAHLSFADLRNVNLSGTDLSNSLLYGARLEGALFDHSTKLPFTKDTALALGMKESL